MVRTMIASGLACLAASVALRAEPMDCAALAKLRLPDVRVTEAVVGDATGPLIKVPHCRVSGVIGKEIRFTVLLPDTWNGKFMMGGGGGFVGSVQNSAQSTVNLGYATAGTDTGHQGNAIQAAWALNDVERQVNFGYLAVHRTAEVSKAIVRARYGSDATKSYFAGCSRGGGQALMEAQRFPDDFDGIVAGAPAYEWTALTALGLRDSQIAFPNPADLSKSTITVDNLKLVGAKILEKCDGTDGVKDGVLDDPRSCAFDIATVAACPDDRPGPECLTRAQRTALKTLYTPLANKAGEIYPGHPVGGEGDPAGWQAWITGVNQQIYSATKAPSLSWSFSTEFYKYLVFNDPTWDYTKYDFSTWRKDTARTASFTDATNPDLTAFKSRGGKLLLWHGWADTAITALGSIKYYQEVESRDPNLRDYFRMFLLPGVLHCGAGAGPDQADWYSAIASWVENGKAPDSIVASKVAQGAVSRTRPLCPFPQHAVYSGTGSTADASNFVCRQP